ncbi:MAG: STAS domain-containing protein [Candidatus Margulisiibacteriota bacterium]
MVLNFSVEESQWQQIPVLHVRGDLDVYTCPDLRKALESVTESGASTLALNLEDIHYLDSTGLGTIAHFAKRLAEKNGAISIISSKPQVEKVLSISGLTKRNIQLFKHETDFQNAHAKL